MEVCFFLLSGSHRQNSIQSKTLFPIPGTSWTWRALGLRPAQRWRIRSVPQPEGPKSKGQSAPADGSVFAGFGGGLWGANPSIRTAPSLRSCPLTLSEDLVREMKDEEKQDGRAFPRQVWASATRHGFLGLLVPQTRSGREVGKLAPKKWVDPPVLKKFPVPMSEALESGVMP